MREFDAELSALLGKTFETVQNAGDEELIFRTADGEVFKFYHEQDCCENVQINDIAGDLDDLIGSPILQAEEVSSAGLADTCGDTDSWDDSCTWTFYKFATIKGSVTVRWLGTSNGYYSEGVSFCRLAA